MQTSGFPCPRRGTSRGGRVRNPPVTVYGFRRWLNNQRPANLQFGHLMFGYLMLTPARRRNSILAGTDVAPQFQEMVGIRQRLLSRHQSHHSLIPVVTVLHSFVDKRQPGGLVVPGSSTDEGTSPSSFWDKVSRIFTPHFDDKLRKTERCTLFFSPAPSSSPLLHFVLLPPRLSRPPVGRGVVFCVPGGD